MAKFRMDFDTLLRSVEFQTEPLVTLMVMLFAIILPVNEYKTSFSVIKYHMK